MVKQNLLTIRILEPLHLGSGEGLGVIDRPILREQTTGYPVIPGSSIKGAIKASILKQVSEEDKETFDAIFGTGEVTGNQGCMVIPGAKLLLFPVRSFRGTFVWTTSLLPLLRLFEYLKMQESNNFLSETEDKPLILKLTNRLASLFHFEFPEKQFAILSKSLVSKPKENEEQTIDDTPSNSSLIFEGFVFKSMALGEKHAEHISNIASDLAELIFPQNKKMREFFQVRFVILPDDSFSYLVRNRTQIDANIEINDRGVTETGSLRYTESLPAETVLFSTVNVSEPTNKSSFDKVKKFISNEIFSSEYRRFGGDETVGKGICQTVYHA